MNNYLIPPIPISTQFSLKTLLAFMTYICFVLAFFKLLGETFLVMSYWILLPYYVFHFLFLFLNLWTYNNPRGRLFRSKLETYWPQDKTFNDMCMFLSSTYMFISYPVILIVFVNIYKLVIR